MRADRERMRAEALRRSILFGAMFGMQVFGPLSLLLIGLYVWLSRTWMAVTAGTALVITLLNLLRWLRARRPPSTQTRARSSSKPARASGTRWDDPQLGPLWFDDGWCLDLVVDGEQVTVRLEPSLDPYDHGPSNDARALWNEIRGDVDGHWRKIVEFTLTWANGCAQAGFTADEFALRSINVTPEQPFCGGEVVYWFEVATDLNGTYFVPVHDGKPEYVHRDS